MSQFMNAMAHPVPKLSLFDSLLLDVFCALAVHLIYNKYEVNPADIAPSLVILFGVPAVPTFFLSDHSDSKALTILVSYGLFYSVLALSVVAYRVSPLHPLAKYPGPLTFKITKFAAMYHALDGKQHHYFKQLHDKYGPYVRIGPNELSIVDVDAIQPVLGLDGMRRGPLWLSHTRPGTADSIITLRDVKQHHERRKLWNRAFTSASLKELQPIVENRVLQLNDELSKLAAKKNERCQTIDLAQWMANFTYDFMGDLVFGGGFNLMREGDKEGVRSLLEHGMKAVAIVQHISWMTRVLFKFAAAPEAELRYFRFATNLYDTRKDQGEARRDLFHYITNEDGFEGAEVSREQGLSEIFTAIVAGADTTSTVLGGLFYQLLSNPILFKRLQSEVDSVFPNGEGEPFDAVKLANMPYLNAVINESLRLQPPLLTSLQRSPTQGSGGKMVAGRFITESTAIYIPPYVLHRDERYFSPEPESFIPERWLDTSGKYTINTSAFIPFSVGPANCAGKNLALLEMRMVVASLVQKFDIQLAEDYDRRQWERDLYDYFVVQVGKLPVALAARA